MSRKLSVRIVGKTTLLAPVREFSVIVQIGGRDGLEF